MAVLQILQGNMNKTSEFTRTLSKGSRVLFSSGFRNFAWAKAGHNAHVRVPYCWIVANGHDQSDILVDAAGRLKHSVEGSYSGVTRDQSFVQRESQFAKAVLDKRPMREYGMFYLTTKVPVWL